MPEWYNADACHWRLSIWKETEAQDPGSSWHGWCGLLIPDVLKCFRKDKQERKWVGCEKGTLAVVNVTHGLWR